MFTRIENSDSTAYVKSVDADPLRQASADAYTPESQKIFVDRVAPAVPRSDDEMMDEINKGLSASAYKSEAQSDAAAVAGVYGPGGASRGAERLERELDDARARMSDADYQKYVSDLNQQMAANPQMVKDLSAAWARKHLDEYDINGDHKLTKAELNLALRTENDAMAKTMLKGVSDQYDTIRKAHFDGNSDWQRSTPDPDAITTADLDTHLKNRDEKIVKDWKKEASTDVNTEINPKETAKEVFDLIGPGGPGMAADRLKRDIDAAHAQLGDGPAYDQYLQRLTANLQKNPAAFAQLSAAWGKDNVSTYDVSGDKGLNQAELDLALRTEDSPLNRAMLQSLRAQYDTLKKAHFDGSYDWQHRVDDPNIITIADFDTHEKDAAKKLRKEWEKANPRLDY